MCQILVQNTRLGTGNELIIDIGDKLLNKVIRIDLNNYIFFFDGYILMFKNNYKIIKDDFM